jgi:hypothetical protein
MKRLSEPLDRKENLLSADDAPLLTHDGIVLFCERETG